MSVKTSYQCNLCGVTSDIAKLQGLVYDTTDHFYEVELSQTPLHICARCKEGVRAFADYELNK